MFAPASMREEDRGEPEDVNVDPVPYTDPRHSQYVSSSINQHFSYSTALGQFKWISLTQLLLFPIRDNV